MSMLSVFRKIGLVLKNPRWALRFFLHPEVLAFNFSRMIGREYYEADIVGINLKFAFYSYHQHRVALEYTRGNLFEPSLLKVWKEKAANASVIYDVGGFNGLFGLLAAKINPSARVVIFEPDPLNAKSVRQNITINNLDNCSLEEVALTDHEGNISFSAMGKTGSHISSDGHGLQVRAATLDSYPRADLIKIDVEGAEAKVIKSGAHALQKRPVIFLEMHSVLANDERELIWKTLKDNGYVWRQIGGSDEGNPHFIVEQKRP
jgi:FkbM family methyltransferase